MFEKASRMKLRFQSAKGALSVEQLWNLPLTSANLVSLDSLAIGIDTEIKQTAGVSFVSNNTGNKELEVKLDILKHIIKVRMDENAAANKASANREQKQKILSVIAKKQDNALECKSVEELAAMAAEL